MSPLHNQRARRIAAAAIIWVTVAPFTAACSRNEGGIAFAANTDNAGSSAAQFIPAARRGDPIDLSGKLLDGRTFNLASVKGRPVVINFWGSWCAPCAEEFPELRTAATRAKSQNLPVFFLGFNQRESPETAAAAYRRYKIPFSSLRNDGGKGLNSFGTPISSFPTTLVLDQEHRLAGRFLGPVTAHSLLQMVEDVDKPA